MLDFLFGYSTKVEWFNVLADVSFAICVFLFILLPATFGSRWLLLRVFNIAATGSWRRARSAARRIPTGRVVGVEPQPATIESEVSPRRPFGPGSRTRSTSPKT